MAAASNENEVSTYDVFLSFRGKDTRTNFTDHLYSAFKQAGFHTFRDDDELVRGDNIEADLHKAIRESRISVVVFSKDYASSTWCLDELVMIMKRMSDSCHTVLPIFYDVSPSQVRKQTQSFGSSFSKHEEQFNKETDRINQWRDALIAAANLSGMELKDRYESDFIRDVVRKLRNKLTPGTRDLSCHLVGAHLRAKEINMWLQEEAHDAWMAIIYGLGGVGKTTIAKILYNKNSERFASSSFISNVRDRSKEPSGLVRIQSQILSDILKGTTHDEVYDIEDGIVKIQKVICRKKILIIFDDVDDSNQLDALLGRRKIRLCPGSKIIFTTRHERLLKADHIYKKFEIKGLNQDESLELFSLHAFKQRKPIVDSYLTCSIEATKWCGGLPLALEVLGSSLCNRSIDVWKDTLQELKLYPDSTIQRVLRISYDSLRNDHDQNLFLNIACFFVGGEKIYVTEILRGCGFFASKGIQNLLDRCLLSIDKYNTLCMHQLLIEMGREIVRQESPDDPGKRSRLWKHSDACIVLQDKTGSANIKGLELDLRMRGSNYVFNQQSMNVASSHPFHLSTESVRMMHKLQILRLYNVNLKGDHKILPKNLVELCWHGFSLRCMPRNFQMEKLISLDLSYSLIISATMVLPKLKFLNLSHCRELNRVPNFCESPCVERLILRGCINIFEVDESIECLKGLLILNLEDCTSLKKLPKSLTTLKSLEEINLSGCSNLEEIPEDLRKMKSLKVFDTSGITINTTTNKKTSIVSLPSMILLHPMVQSWLTSCKRLLSSTLWHPTNFSLASLPSSLVELTLENCNLSDDDIPSDLSYLGSLTILNLSGNLFHSLPESISSLHKLDFLHKH